MQIDTSLYQTKLQAEKNRLVEELNAIGSPNPDKPNDWQAGVSDMDEPAFREEVADRLEELQEREGTESNLEKRLADIERALEKINSGQFGICEISGEEIEADRLEANPAARTCKAHIDQEDSLF